MQKIFKFLFEMMSLHIVKEGTTVVNPQTSVSILQVHLQTDPDCHLQTDPIRFADLIYLSSSILF